MASGTERVIWFVDATLPDFLFSLIDACNHAQAFERVRDKTSRNQIGFGAMVSLGAQTRFRNFVDLRQTFPSADVVGKFTVFDIGGNKVRLIAAIHYNRGKLYIRHVLTHEEYDRGNWKKP